ncbi:hypothetical protein FACS18942_10560 [Planctomycetales bacterium]|nr:hypothetical protein FACS18942_10560 [Planctomycetales bacterium]GHT39407.1 hypothetical protein FACS189427_13530 [Planctomycetales bacterium]
MVKWAIRLVHFLSECQYTAFGYAYFTDEGERIASQRLDKKIKELKLENCTIFRQNPSLESPQPVKGAREFLVEKSVGKFTLPKGILVGMPLVSNHNNPIFVGTVYFSETQIERAIEYGNFEIDILKAIQVPIEFIEEVPAEWVGKITTKLASGPLFGATIGDICGSIYEGYRRNKKTDRPEKIELINPRCHFTDDTVLTVAIAEAVFTDRDYMKAAYKWANKFPRAGYGGGFKSWFYSTNPQPYNSWGNGSAMRVSAIGWAFDTLEETLEEAKRSAEITHNHPEGIDGAMSVAAAIFLARNDASKKEIKKYVEKNFAYDLHRKLDDIRLNYRGGSRTIGSVPEAILAFLESDDFRSAIQLAISIGGESDTIACIAASIAEAHYRDIPQELIEFSEQKLTHEMQLVLGWI